MPGYEVKFERLLLGDSHFQVRSLLNRQQFSDPQGVASALGISEASWPLFGLIWPSARILANAMQCLDIKGQRILEIGCGLALASLVIHRRLGDITASDCHPLAETFLQENTRINALPQLKYKTGQWDRSNPDLGKFDLIIASDVLYERNQPGMLANFIQLHAHTNTNIIVVDPDRGNRNAFCRQMANNNFVVEMHRANRKQSTGEAYKGHFLHFTHASRHTIH